MLEGVKKWTNRILYALPFGLKAGDEIIAAPTTDGTEGAGIHQTKQTKSVWADLLEGKLTKEAEAMRYTMYLAEEKSNEYEYLGNGLAKKRENPINTKKFRMKNNQVVYTQDEALEIIGKNNNDVNSIPERRLVTIESQNSTPRFNLTKYVEEIRIDLSSPTKTIELMFENDKRSRRMKPFLSYINAFFKKLDNAINDEVREKFIKGEDICNLKYIEFTTEGCTNNVPNGIHYLLHDLKFSNFKCSDDFHSIKYVVGNYDDGKLLSEKFYCKEQDERYQKKEKKENGAAPLIDIAAASETINGGEEENAENTQRHGGSLTVNENFSKN